MVKLLYLSIFIVISSCDGMEESESASLLERKSKLKRDLIKSDIGINNNAFTTLYVVFKGQRSLQGDELDFERLQPLSSRSTVVINKKHKWLLPLQIWVYQKIGSWLITGDRLDFVFHHPKKFSVESIHSGNFVFYKKGEEICLKDVGFITSREIKQVQ